MRLESSDYVRSHLLGVPGVALAAGVGVQVPGVIYLGSPSLSKVLIIRQDGATDLDLPVE